MAQSGDWCAGHGEVFVGNEDITVWGAVVKPNMKKGPIFFRRYWQKVLGDGGMECSWVRVAWVWGVWVDT